MSAHDTIEVFDVYKAMKLPAIYEKLSAITVVDLESKLPFITSKDPLERALVGYDIFGDGKSNKMIRFYM